MDLIKNIAYQTLDVITFGKGVKRNIGGETIRFPSRFSRYYESNYEPETFKFFRENLKLGDTVLDIGAHIGLFSVLISRLVGKQGKVFSFEPTPFTRSILQEVINLNEVSDIAKVRGEAVSDKKGNAFFYDTETEISNANSLVKTDLGKKQIEVSLISVDEFVNENNLKINCLKIDVEGAELNLLKGAKETFLNHRPVARLGLHPPFIKENGQTLEEIWDILKQYNLEVIFEGKEISKEFFCKQSTLFDVNLLPR